MYHSRAKSSLPHGLQNNKSRKRGHKDPWTDVCRFSLTSNNPFGYQSVPPPMFFRTATIRAVLTASFMGCILSYYVPDWIICTRMDEIVDAFSARLVAKRRPSFKSFMVVLPYIRGDLPYNEDGPVAPITYLLSRLSLNGSVQQTCEEDETMTPPESETHPAAEAINEKPNTFPQMREPVVQKHNPVTPPVVVYSSPVCANETQPIFHPGEQQQAEAPNESATQQSGYQDHTAQEMDEQGVIFPNGHWQPATGTAGFVTHPDVSSMLWITTPSTVEQPGAPSGDLYPPQYGFPSPYFTSENVSQQVPVPGLNEAVDVSTGLSPYPNGGLAPPITTHSGMFSLSTIDPQLSGISGPDAMPQESMPLTCDIPQPGVTCSATQQGGSQHHTAQEIDEQGVIFPNGHWQPATGTAGFVTHPDVSSTLWITAPSMAQQPGAPSGDPYPPQYGFPSPYFTSENVPQQALVPGLNEVVDLSTGLSPYPNGGAAPPITSHSGTFSLSVIDPQLLAISGLNPMPQESMPEDPPDSHDRPMRPLPRRGVPQSQAGPPTSVCDLLALNNIGTREFCLALKKYQETTVNKYYATSCETLLQMFQQYSLLNSAPFVFAAWTCETQPLGDDPTGVEFTLRDLESPQDDPVRLTFQQILFVIKFICGTLPLYQINVTSLDTP
ncbi:hypothetical protein BU17DRAFT_102384 [Hysterangium stoloniferum]|nr:hypothetical protein BU17DRAFT_102384 [Hysterangium stoloniferum]